MTAVTLATDRLILRPWLQSDRQPFATMCADPTVMEFFPSTMSRAECDAWIDRVETLFAERGWGLWVVEIPGELPFAGFVGLAVPSFQSHFTPCVEIGWRLVRSAWGQGIATEAARAAANFGFEQLGLNELVSFTAIENVRSRRVMERLGMTHNPADDFDHPALPEGHWLRRHVLYRLTRGVNPTSTSPNDTI